MIVIKAIWIVLISNFISSIKINDKINFQPTRYLLQFRVNPEQDVFQGCTIIFLKVDGECEQNDLNFDIHREFITITAITKNIGRKECKYEYLSNNTDIFHVHCEGNQTFTNGDFITITYTGKYSTDMKGFYKSSYMEENKNKTLLVTQFESVYARRAFPCLLDEPIYKARFSIIIECPKEYTALSNTQIDRKYKSETDDNYMTYEFAETPVMSTYLVAFMISQLEPSPEDETGHLYKYNIYARPSANKLMTTALKYGKQVIDTMSLWIKINYEDLGNIQINQVALPYLAPGAMENWGLITYREEALLDQGNITSASRKQYIITIMAHEISHQWFGDFVTTDWWSNIWLNEGFATYFEYHIPSKVLNYEAEDMEMEKQFVGDKLIPALYKDEHPLHPLSCQQSIIQTAPQIDGMFDTISYAKGGSIIRMMSYVLGIGVFRLGLTSYLRDRKYQYATPEILLNHLENAPGNKIEAFTEKMKAWIYKPGFPVVNAKLNKSNSEIILTQRNINTESKTEWYIPISYTTSSKKRFTFDDFLWLEPNNTLKVPFKNESWIIFNLQVIGYYRVNYDAELIDNIIIALKGEDRNKIDALNKAQLIEDIFNSVRMGQIHYKKFIDLVDYLRNETDYYPWNTALKIFNYILDKVDDECQILLKKWILKQIESAFGETINDTGNKHISLLKNEMLQLWKCKLGQTKCLDYARINYANFKIHESLQHDDSYLVFCYALKYSHNTTGDYNFLINILKTSTSIERRPILLALGCFSDPDILSKYLLDTISSDSPIKIQEASAVYVSILSNGKVGIDVILEFIENNFTSVSDRFQDTLTLTLTYLVEKVITDEQREKLKKIISNHAEDTIIKNFRNNWIDVINNNKKWTSNDGAEIKSILREVQSNAPIVVPTIITIICTLFLINF